MGAWGVNTFDNDTACDWSYDLEAADDLSPVREAFVVDKLFMSLGSEWDGFAVSVSTLHDAGDYVVMEGRYTGTYKPSGRKLNAQVCHILRFSNGKLSSFQQYTDTAQLQAVMARR